MARTSTATSLVAQRSWRVGRPSARLAATIEATRAGQSPPYGSRRTVRSSESGGPVDRDLQPSCRPAARPARRPTRRRSPRRRRPRPDRGRRPRPASPAGRRRRGPAAAGPRCTRAITNVGEATVPARPARRRCPARARSCRRRAARQDQSRRPQHAASRAPKAGCRPRRQATRARPAARWVGPAAARASRRPARPHRRSPIAPQRTARGTRGADPGDDLVVDRAGGVGPVLRRSARRRWPGPNSTAGVPGRTGSVADVDHELVHADPAADGEPARR